MIYQYDLYTRSSSVIGKRVVLGPVTAGTTDPVQAGYNSSHSGRQTNVLLLTGTTAG